MPVKENEDKTHSLFSELKDKEPCSLCGHFVYYPYDCLEFGNPQCPCFGIGLEEYEKRYSSN